MATASESQPRFLDEFDRFFRIRVMAADGMSAAFLAFVELRADEMAEFGFHHAIVFVGVFHDFPGDFDVFLKRLVAGVNHHAGETLRQCTPCTSSNVSPWSRCTAIGMVDRLTAASMSFLR